MIETGVDIVEISRIVNIYKRYGDRFLNRIFTNIEIEYLKSKKYKGESIAGLFAGKEAVSKSLGIGIGELNWKDIEIYHNEFGRPKIRILNNNYIKDHKFSISISHEKQYAIAFVLIYK